MPYKKTKGNKKGQGKQKRNLLKCPSCGASQGSFVLEAGLEPARPFRGKGF